MPCPLSTVHEAGASTFHNVPRKKKGVTTNNKRKEKQNVHAFGFSKLEPSLLLVNPHFPFPPPPPTLYISLSGSRGACIHLIVLETAAFPIVVANSGKSGTWKPPTAYATAAATTGKCESNDKELHFIGLTPPPSPGTWCLLLFSLLQPHSLTSILFSFHLIFIHNSLTLL